jgi:calcium channel MID1
VGHIWAGEELREEVTGGDVNERGYRGDFAYFEPDLVGRAPEGVDALTDGEKLNKEAAPGTTKYFVLERQKPGAQARSEEGENASEADADAEGVQKRQTSGQLYISVNTCSQPIPDTPIAIDPPPQLKLYVSTSTRNQKPGPSATDDLAGPVATLQGGAAMFTVQGVDTDVYVGIEAPSLTDGWKGNFRFEVAVSSERPYHSYVGNDPFLFMIDTDSESALFITHDLTNNTDKNVIQKWLDVPNNPFQMYAFPETAWGAKGLEHSVCGIKEAYGTNSSNVSVDKKMTERYGDDHLPKMPKSQFHVQGLQRNMRYTGFLLMDGEVETEGLDLGSKNLTVGRGGRVWRQFAWKTKSGVYYLPTSPCLHCPSHCFSSL